MTHEEVLALKGPCWYSHRTLLVTVALGTILTSLPSISAVSVADCSLDYPSRHRLVVAVNLSYDPRHNNPKALSARFLGPCAAAAAQQSLTNYTHRCGPTFL